MSRTDGRLRIAVLGTMGADPFAGMAWMHLQIAAGLLRLGHDVRYVETTSAWPYDVERGTRIDDAGYTLRYLARVAERFGMGQRWAWRRSWGDGAWLGPAAADAAAWLAGTDLVLNVAGATQISRDGFKSGPVIHFGTDPVSDELRYAAGDARTREHVDAHAASVTYGENLGTPRCPLPPLPRQRARLRQPVLMDLWDNPGPPPGAVFTTVGNWRQDGKDEVFQGRPLRWSKHHEFLKFIDVPRLSGQTVELATNLSRPDVSEAGSATSDAQDPHQIRGAASLDRDHWQRLQQGGWRVADGPALSVDPFTYRDYILGSRAEFTVAREFNVLPRTAWFSERSACYLAAGRPVVTQDTGFSDVLPTGEGLFGFDTAEQAVEAIRAIEADYPRHARAARAIAHDWFRAEVVLARMLADLGA
jgi:hypothetical protein